MHPLLMTMGTPSPCTISGTLSATGAGPTVTSSTRTITVPAGNTGQLQIKNQVETGTLVFEYSKNGGAWTDAEPNPTSITFADADTLAVRATGVGAGEQISFDLFDVTTSTTIGTYLIEGP